MSHWRLRSVLVGVVCVCGSAWRPADGGTRAAEFAAIENRPRLPGEFEDQQAIVIAWSGDAATDRALVNIVVAAGSKTQFVVLIPTEADRIDAADMMRRAGVAAGRVQFLQLPFDTVWTRDYGPLVVEAADGAARILDTTYPCPERIQDDCIPVALSLMSGVPLTEVPLDLDGGNLLSNGAGLCIATRELVQQNAHRGYNEQVIDRLLVRHFGFEDVLFLEPLVDEPTGHVDMFATFTAADTVVVGELDPEFDELNAAVLDRNAERLQRVVTPFGPLKVVRIPMPPAEDGIWRTYTNVLYANGRLLMPVYPGFDAKGQAGAAKVFEQLLPRWKVVGIDCRDLIQLGGAIHCVTLNLCRFPKLRQPAVPFQFAPFPPDLDSRPFSTTADSATPDDRFPSRSAATVWRRQFRTSRTIDPIGRQPASALIP